MSSNKIAVYLLIFLIFFVTQNRVGGERSEFELLRGLADRGLFDSVESFYKKELKKFDQTRSDKYSLAASVVYSRTLQILTATEPTRTQLFKQLVKFEAEFQNDVQKIQQQQQQTNSFSAESLELIRLRLQFAVFKYLLGSRLWFESGISADNKVAAIISESQKMLSASLDQLKEIKIYLAAQQNQTFADQIELLSNEVELYFNLVEISYALTLPQSNNRYDKLSQIAVRMDEWSKRKLEFYAGKLNLRNSKILRRGYCMVLRVRAELAACYRLAQEFDKAFAVLNSKELALNLDSKSDDLMLSDDLQLKIAAERIRFLTAIINNVTIIHPANNPMTKDSEKSGWDIGNLSALFVPLSADSLEYCLAKLELVLFLAGRATVTDSSTELMIVEDILEIVRQMELNVPSSGYCAAVVIGANKFMPQKITNTKFNEIRTTVLSISAQNKNEHNQIMEAVKLYELAGQTAGNKEIAIKNIQYSISLLYTLLKQLETPQQKTLQNLEPTQELNDKIFRCRLLIMNMLCDWACRFAGERIAVELYRRGIHEATILFKTKQLNLDAYIAILNGYISQWANESDCAVYGLRAANLLELNDRFEEALVFLDKIPNSSDQATEAVTVADRCFKQLRNKNQNKTNDNGENEINEFKWFRRRLREDILEWSEADAVTVIKMAERLFYKNNVPMFYWEMVDGKLLGEMETILVNAINKCKTTKPVTIARLKMMLVIVYNLQGNHVKSTELLKQIDVEREQLTVVERLFLRRFEVERLVLSGDTRGAVKLLEVMLGVDLRNLMLLELKAEILSRQEDRELLTDAVKTWGIIGSITKENSEQWWQAREKIITILIKQDNHNEANKIYKKLKFLHPNLDNESRKNRLEKLMGISEN
ncbi:MAG: hypothetical protein LBJ00_05125 [Planctomycetaceae bacterium]|jgi:hypothetical protein|nr:hypothetical protein [Planctomycetaceae bacterium]